MRHVLAAPLVKCDRRGRSWIGLPAKPTFYINEHIGKCPVGIHPPIFGINRTSLLGGADAILCHANLRQPGLDAPEIDPTGNPASRCRTAGRPERWNPRRKYDHAGDQRTYPTEPSLNHVSPHPGL